MWVKGTKMWVKGVTHVLYIVVQYMEWNSIQNS